MPVRELRGFQHNADTVAALNLREQARGRLGCRQPAHALHKGWTASPDVGQLIICLMHVVYGQKRVIASPLHLPVSRWFLRIALSYQ